MLIGCTGDSNHVVRLPDKMPTIMRSVLDQQVRMITIATGNNSNLAYNTEHCSFYKFWSGGVHWNGAAFNNTKTVQPQSWGESYLESAINVNPWKLIQNQREHKVKLQYKGHTLNDGQPIFKYELQNSSTEPIYIYEAPLVKLKKNGNVTFERNFKTENLPDEIVLFNGDIKMPHNGTFNANTEYLQLPILVKPPGMASTSGAQYWLDRSGCNTCHHQTQNTIGPSYHAIATEYDSEVAVIAELSSKVKFGTKGTWGNTSMQAHPDLSEKDITMMVQYILSLNSSKNNVRTKRTRKANDEEEKVIPGFGSSLVELHPSLTLINIRPEWFKPRVAGMDFTSDGKLLVSTWDSLGAVYAIDNLNKTEGEIEIKCIAKGLSEPLGIKVVDDDIYVLQKHELTQLVDHNGDGVIDEYKTICNEFGATPDFHEFSYGLEYRDGYFYANLGLAMRLMSHEQQHEDRGTTIRIDKNGQFEKIMIGLRQANGIGFGIDDQLFITENQGNWSPACKIIHVQEGTFQGCHFGTGDRYKGLREIPPAVWLPQDEIGNSPSQPTLLKFGSYKGQMLHGDVTHGGLKRVFLEKINNSYQGCVFRFTQGLEAGINRLAWGPDNALYVGGVGMNGNWGWKGKQYGLQKLIFTDRPVFEILSIQATASGFDINFTLPIDEQTFDIDNMLIDQWRYENSSRYGSPKFDLLKLKILQATISPNGKAVHLDIEGLKKEHVIHFLLDYNLKSKNGQELWSGEAWYTLNNIPKNGSEQ
jgi:cytochrome c